MLARDEAGCLMNKWVTALPFLGWNLPSWLNFTVVLSVSVMVGSGVVVRLDVSSGTCPASNSTRVYVGERSRDVHGAVV